MIERHEAIARRAPRMWCAAALVVACASIANAQSFTENFEPASTGCTGTNSNCPMLTGAGWVLNNLSDATGPNGWFHLPKPIQDPPDFGAQSGSANSYLAADFLNTESGGMDTISNWLISPVRTFENGDMISFWTRTRTNSTRPDRLQLRISLAGASTFIGVESTSTGVFTLLGADINANQDVGGYPTVWQQYLYTFAGLGGPTSGRFAFRYFVTDAGPLPAPNGNLIGIDTVTYTHIPEPTTIALLLIPALLVRRRR